MKMGKIFPIVHYPCIPVFLNFKFNLNLYVSVIKQGVSMQISVNEFTGDSRAILQNSGLLKNGHRKESIVIL